MKIMIVGDVHLGKSLSIGKSSYNGELNSRVQDQVDLLNWVNEYCNINNINNIIFTGDIFQDYRPHPTFIGEFFKFLNRSNKKIHIVLGNHDIIRSGQCLTSALDLIEAAQIKNTKLYKDFELVKIGNINVGFVPFRDKRMYEAKDTEEANNKLISDIKKITDNIDNASLNIIVGHLAFEGCLSIGDEISDNLNELYVSPNLFEKFDYAIMGHIHHAQVIQHKKPYACHIGSLDRSDFSKTEINYDKIGIVIDSESNEKYKEVILPVRPLKVCKIDVNDQDSTNFVITKLSSKAKEENFKHSIIRLEIILYGENIINVNRDIIEEFLYKNLEVFHICSFSESRAISSVSIDKDNNFNNEMSLKQTIKQWSENNKFESEDIKNEFLYLANRCLKEYEEKFLK